MFTTAHWIAFAGLGGLAGLISLTTEKDLRKTLGYLRTMLVLELLGFWVAIDGNDEALIAWSFLGVALGLAQFWTVKTKQGKHEEINN